MAVTVSFVQVINSKQVRLTTSKLHNGSTYQASVANVKDIDGNTIPVLAPRSFVATAAAPQVTSAAYVDITNISLTFSEVMLNDANLTNPAHYAVTGPTTPTVTDVTVSVDGKTVQLELDSDLVTGTYTVTATNVSDLGNNLIDPSHDEASFTQTVKPFRDHPTLEVGLIAHYKMEGNANDASPQGYDGAFPSGDPTITAGKINNALRFTAPQQMSIAPNDDFDGLNAFTMSIWTKIPTIASAEWHGLCGRRGQCVLAVVGGGGEHQGKVWLGTYHVPGSPVLGQTLGTTVLSDNTWYHIVGQFNGVNWTYLYVNGELETSKNYGAVLTVVDATHPMRIGVMQNTTAMDGNEDINSPLEGIADEITFWNRRILSEEITYLYNSGNGVPY